MFRVWVWVKILVPKVKNIVPKVKILVPKVKIFVPKVENIVPKVKILVPKVKILVTKVQILVPKVKNVFRRREQLSEQYWENSCGSFVFRKGRVEMEKKFSKGFGGR